MKKYMFCDHDDSGDNEYEIEGWSFDILIELSLRYCKYFSLAYAENIRAVKELDPFEIAFAPSDELKQKWDRFDVFHSRLPRKYYRLTRESAAILRNIAEGISNLLLHLATKIPRIRRFSEEMIRSSSFLWYTKAKAMFLQSRMKMSASL